MENFLDKPSVLLRDLLSFFINYLHMLGVKGVNKNERKSIAVVVVTNATFRQIKLLSSA